MLVLLFSAALLCSTSSAFASGRGQLQQYPSGPLPIGSEFLVVEHRSNESGSWEWRVMQGRDRVWISEQHGPTTRHLALFSYAKGAGEKVVIRSIFHSESGYDDTTFYTPELHKTKAQQHFWVRMQNVTHPFCAGDPRFGAVNSMRLEDPSQTIEDYFIDSLHPWLTHEGRKGDYIVFRNKTPKDWADSVNYFTMFIVVRNGDGNRQLLIERPIVGTEPCKTVPQPMVFKYPEEVYAQESGTIRILNAKKVKWNIKKKPEWIEIKSIVGNMLTFRNTFDTLKKYKELIELEKNQQLLEERKIETFEYPAFEIEARFLTEGNEEKEEMIYSNDVRQYRSLERMQFTHDSSMPWMAWCGHGEPFAAVPYPNARYEWMFKGLPTQATISDAKTAIARITIPQEHCDTSTMVQAWSITILEDGRRDTVFEGYRKMSHAAEWTKEVANIEGWRTDTTLAIRIKQIGQGWGIQESVASPVLNWAQFKYTISVPADVQIRLNRLDNEEELLRVEYSLQMPDTYSIDLNATSLSECGYDLRVIVNGQTTNHPFYVER